MFIKCIVFEVLNVVKVSCCGLCALLERLKVGDADIYLIIISMHHMQGKELAIFTKIVRISIATLLVLLLIFRLSFLLSSSLNVD